MDSFFWLVFFHRLGPIPGRGCGGIAIHHPSSIIQHPTPDTGHPTRTRVDERIWEASPGRASGVEVLGTPTMDTRPNNGGADGEYGRGLRLLESLITGRKRKDGAQWEHAFQMMQGYLEKLGLEPQKLAELHAIHVTGTKGKGSTCAMVDSILRSCGYTTGLFTSPHLIDVRERIRISGEKVDEALFLRYLFDTYGMLADNGEDSLGEDSGKPAYFRFLTLLAFRIFLHAQVDVAILEVGLGGRLDATNCIREPVVCGISMLGFDHMNVLGHTLPEISREKAGIFKKGAPALTVPQRADAQETLEAVAGEKGVDLAVVPPLSAYKGAQGIELGLAGAHQVENAALAVRLAAVWEASHGRKVVGKVETSMERSQRVLERLELPKEYVAGLERVRWPGRAEIFDDEEAAGLTFFVDGAHTPESIGACATWFSAASIAREARDAAAKAVGATDSTADRVVIFNCMEERDPESLLEPLRRELLRPGAEHVWPSEIIFSPTTSSYTKLSTPNSAGDTAWQGNLSGVWQRLVERGHGSVHGSGAECPRVGQSGQHRLPKSVVSPSLAETLRRVRSRAKSFGAGKRLHVLVTGSLYLVGDLLSASNRTM